MDAVEAYVRLFERQMAHYENTQGIEWKVSIGIWTLLALAIKWASEISRGVPGWWLVFLVPLAHGVHWSEESDKTLWGQHRAAALAALGDTKATASPTRRWWKELLWLLPVIAVTFVMAWILGSQLQPK